jgi:hypothetical protein
VLLLDRDDFAVTVAVAPSAVRVYAPHVDDVDPPLADTHLIDALHAHARDAHFSSIDLLDGFAPHAAEAADELLYFRDDDHWSPRGHAVVAALVARQLGGPRLGHRPHRLVVRKPALPRWLARPGRPRGGTGCGVGGATDNGPMKMRGVIVAAVACTAILSPLRVRADPVGTVAESGKTAADAVRDGALTAGRTTRDFVEHGPHTAKRTWKANAAKTKSDARANGDQVKREAQSEK